jgi:hypothetical protein
MAEKSGPDETPVELWRKIGRSRELVVRDAGALRYELNFKRKFNQAFQRNTIVWVGAALAVGLFIALLRARPQKIYVNAAGKKVRPPNKTLLESGALLGLVKLAMTVVQPVVTSYFAKKGAKQGKRAYPERDR